MHYSSHERRFKTDGEIKEEIHDMLKIIGSTAYSLGSVHSVVVTHVNGPKSFFVRPAIFSGQLDFLQCRKARLDQRDARLGNIIVYYSHIRFKYVRGQIRYIRKDNDVSLYDMFAIDYGWEDKSIPINQMFQPYFKHHVPSLVRHCKLASWEGVRARSDSSFREMRVLLGEEKPIQMVVKIPDPFMLSVSLRNGPFPPGFDKVVVLMDSDSLAF